MTKLETNKALVRKFIDDVWNSRNTAAIQNYIAPGYVDSAYDPPDQRGHTAMIGVLVQAVPDAEWTIDRVVCEGDVVVCELTLTGTHQGLFRGREPKRNPIKVRAYRTFEIRDGRIASHAALLDTSRLLMQMEA